VISSKVFVLLLKKQRHNIQTIPKKSIVHAYIFKGVLIAITQIIIRFDMKYKML